MRRDRALDAARVWDFAAESLAGEPVPLRRFAGHVALVVNVASRCRFTPQYRELQALYDRHSHRGFVVLGFPCNQFGNQEPGDAAAIARLCDLTYGVRFPMFAKIEVNGAGAHPLFRFLKRARPGVLGSQAIKWNFTKFLVARDGRVVARYAPVTRPASLEPEIERLLAGPA